MNEEYLWDKTGTDSEIERLENALTAFRYQRSEPPALPAKIIPFEAKNSRGFFRLAFAFASFAALLIVCLSVWFQSFNSKIEVANNAQKTIAPPMIENHSEEIAVESPPNRKAEMPQSIKPQIVSLKKIAAQNNLKRRFVETKKPQNLTARNIETKKPAVKLTSEETYAYNQLMLALSITGSKLRLVSDKVENVEETKAREDGR